MSQSQGINDGLLAWLAAAAGVGGALLVAIIDGNTWWLLLAIPGVAGAVVKNVLSYRKRTRR